MNIQIFGRSKSFDTKKAERYFKERRVKKFYVGDSSIVGTDTIEALKSTGIWQVCEEEGVECLNLDDSGIQEREIPAPVMVEPISSNMLGQALPSRESGRPREIKAR